MEGTGIKFKSEAFFTYACSTGSKFFAPSIGSWKGIIECRQSGKATQHNSASVFNGQKNLNSKQCAQGHLTIFID
jgi:hypothetical protein